MLLEEYLSRYSRLHDVRPATLEHYHWVIRSFERHNGALRTSDLSGAAVSAWLAWLADCGRSPWTIKQRRISLLVLWRAAWQDGVAPPLEPVRRLRPVRHSPQAWTLDEVRQLIHTAEQLPVRARWWSSLVRAAYDSGLRLGDLLALTVDQLGPVMGLAQAKTGRPVVCQLRPTTLWAIRLHLAGRTTGLVWPWPYRREATYRHFKRLVAASAIRPGTFRWLRRAAATQLERVEPGRGTELLGHANRATTEQFYIDRSQLQMPPLPPL
jgi:integrase